MYLSTNTLDDLLRKLFAKLLRSKSHITASRGAATELFGVLLKISNPRARLSRTEKKGRPFGCLGELLWYLAGSNKLRFIKYYLPRYADDSEDGRTIYGGYGPRLFDMYGFNQVKNVLALLRQRPSSRRAVIQLFDAKDIARHRKEIPCTCTLQIVMRRNRLHMIASMRSNDVFLGLPNDVFAFTMMQELFARALNVELGTYKHVVGSLHLYDRDKDSARLFIDEGWQPTMPMPPMPIGDPWPSVRTLLRAEPSIRRAGRAGGRASRLDPYWQDLLRLLQIHWHFKNNNPHAIARIKKQMHSRVYDSYIERLRRTARLNQAPSEIAGPTPS
jgi:thymidylate synthase